MKFHLSRWMTKGTARKLGVTITLVGLGVIISQRVGNTSIPILFGGFIMFLVGLAVFGQTRAGKTG